MSGAPQEFYPLILDSLTEGVFTVDSGGGGSGDVLKSTEAKLILRTPKKHGGNRTRVRRNSVFTAPPSSAR